MLLSGHRQGDPFINILVGGIHVGRVPINSTQFGLDLVYYQRLSKPKFNNAVKVLKLPT